MAARVITSLKLEEFGDRELLNIMLDLGGGDWVEAAAIAKQCGVVSENPIMSVRSRLSWLKRYGAVENDPDEKGHWRPTATGAAMATGKLPMNAQKALSHLPDEDLLALTREVTRRYHGTNATGAHLIRREWRYGTFMRRNGG